MPQKNENTYPRTRWVQVDHNTAGRKNWDKV